MKQCYLCGKHYINSVTRKLLRGHYNPTKTSRKQPNLQWGKLPGETGRVKLCIKCLRTNKKSSKKSATK